MVEHACVAHDERKCVASKQKHRHEVTEEGGTQPPLDLFIPQEDWENISRESRFHGNVNMVSWNPLLKTDVERLSFEGFAQTQTFKVGAEPECFLCGSERRGYSNPDHLVNIPGFGIFRCDQLEMSGRQGVIPNGNCAFISDVGRQQGCDCFDLDSSVEVLTSEV